MARGHFSLHLPCQKEMFSPLLIFHLKLLSNRNLLLIIDIQESFKRQCFRVEGISPVNELDEYLALIVFLQSAFGSVK